MQLKIAKFEQTPNPDALKCVLAPRSDTPGPNGGAEGDQPSHPAQPVAPLARLRSYRSLDEASGDPLARAILTIPGIAGVLILDDFITITRAPGTPWPPLKRALEAALGTA